MAKKSLFVLSLLAINLAVAAVAMPVHAQVAPTVAAAADAADDSAIAPTATEPVDGSYGYNPGPYFVRGTYSMNTPCSTTMKSVNYPLYYYPTFQVGGYGGCGGGCGGYGGMWGGLWNRFGCGRWF